MRRVNSSLHAEEPFEREVDMEDRRSILKDSEQAYIELLKKKSDAYREIALEGKRIEQAFSCQCQPRQREEEEVEISITFEEFFDIMCQKILEQRKIFSHNVEFESSERYLCLHYVPYQCLFAVCSVFKRFVHAVASRTHQIINAMQSVLCFIA